MSLNSAESLRPLTLLKKVRIIALTYSLFKMRVVWDIMSSRIINSYRLTGLPVPEDEGSTVHRNDGKYLPVDIL